MQSQALLFEDDDLATISSSSGPELRFSFAESVVANAKWGANCGPHSLAAALGLTLDEVRLALGRFKGWMSPTAMEDALRRLTVDAKPAKGLRTTHLADGINRLQWEGPWLAPGVAPAHAYPHTHWVAHRAGLVLCTVVHPAQWTPVQEWTARLAATGRPWHVTHHYRLLRP